MLTTWSKIKMRDIDDEIYPRIYPNCWRSITMKLNKNGSQKSKTPTNAPLKKVQNFEEKKDQPDISNKSNSNYGSTVNKRPNNLKRVKQTNDESSLAMDEKDFLPKEKHFFIKTIKIFNNSGLLHETLVESIVPSTNRGTNHNEIEEQ